jgi:UDP-glucose 4-epimerase
MAECLVREYTRLERVRGISLRFVANCGPHSSHGLIHDIVKKLRSDTKELELLGDYPGSVKPFCYVKDTCQAIISALNSSYNGPINICTSQVLSVYQVANIVMKELGINKPIKWLGEESNWEGDDLQVCCSNRLAYEILKWRPTYKGEGVVKMAVQEN